MCFTKNTHTHILPNLTKTSNDFLLFYVLTPSQLNNPLIPKHSDFIPQEFCEEQVPVYRRTIYSCYEASICKELSCSQKGDSKISKCFQLRPSDFIWNRYAEYQTPFYLSGSKKHIPKPNAYKWCLYILVFKD